MVCSSGKCQIIHWRQGHKQECQQPDTCNSNLSGSPAFSESSFISSSQTENPKNPLFGFEHPEPVLESIPPHESIHPQATSPYNAIQHSMNERVCSEKRISRKFGGENSDREDTILYGYPEAANCIGATTLTSACPVNFSQPKVYPQRKKLSRDNFPEASDRTPKEKNFNHHPISEQSTPQPPYRLTSKNGIASGTNNESCIRKSLYSERMGINGNRCEMDFTFTNDHCLEEELPSRNETSDLSACNENIVLEAITGSGNPLDVSASEVFISQRPMRKGRKEHTCAVRERTVSVGNKPRIPHEISSQALPIETSNGSLKMGGMKILGLKKLAKLTRHQNAGRTGDNLKKNMSIGCQMGGGDQEDAHEFLRLLVTSMQSICLKGFGGEKVVDSRLQETTLIQQIFGGHLRSKILGWVESLEDALTQFTSPEELDGENMCAAHVKARKQLSIHEAPNILTIVLKRFQTGKYGKINKGITFPDMLDMNPFMTGTGDCPPLYMLYGVVVHLDTLNASFSGHYVSYVKDLQGTWFRIDDGEVESVQVGQVMSEGAYILFYSRSYPRPPRAYGGGSALMQASAAAGQCSSRSERSSRDQQRKQELLFTQGHSPQSYSANEGDFLNEVTYSQTRDHGLGAASNNIPETRQTYVDAVGVDFSDATSSDWSLFTSSDESSFTTESTRDSFSTVDYGDTLNIDPISSIFGTYHTAYHSNNRVSCTKFSPSRPQTRYFQEMNCIISDSSMSTKTVDAVQRVKNLEHVTIPLNESRSPSATDCSMFVRHGANPRSSFVRTSGCL
ncbi:ubiquitin-specific protease ubp15 [Asimina triloba]